MAFSAVYMGLFGRIYRILLPYIYRFLLPSTSSVSQKSQICAWLFGRIQRTLLPYVSDFTAVYIYDSCAIKYLPSLNYLKSVLFIRCSFALALHPWLFCHIHRALSSETRSRSISRVSNVCSLLYGSSDLASLGKIFLTVKETYIYIHRSLSVKETYLYTCCKRDLYIF